MHLKCPYCGFPQTKKKEGTTKTFQCPRCEYIFEVSRARITLEAILSIPFSSIIYSSIIITGTYFLAKIGFPDVSKLSFGLFYSFLIILCALFSFFILFLTTERGSQIFLIKEKKKNLYYAFKSSSPLFKMGIIFLLTALIIPFFFI
ncbi:MAG: hypothetical protein ACTSUR_03175 [Candidatus Heimdallarchaeaceae archaeon]